MVGNINITEDYVSFEVAKLLKEKGFDEESWCLYDLVSKKFAREIVTLDFRYNHNLPNYVASAPTLQTAMKWLRKVHNIGIFPSTYCLLKDGEVTHPYGTCITNLLTHEIIVDDCLPAETYEDAIEKALIYCLTNLI